jgi:hypothetical protein
MNTIDFKRRIIAILKFLINPVIGGGIFFLSTLIYYYFVNSLPRVDNPSSTDVIKYVFQMGNAISAGILGLIIGLAIGKIIELLTKKFSKQESNYLKTSRYILSGILLFICLMIGLNNFSETKKLQYKWNKNNTQEVKLNNGDIKKITTSDFSGTTTNISNFDLNLNESHAIGYIGHSELKNKNTLDWNGKKYIISFGSYGVFLNDEAGTKFIEQSTEGFNYINGITYLTYPKNSSSSYLFALARLRATSEQSLLLVYSNTGKLVYQELMGANDILEYGKLNNGKEVIVLGNTKLGDKKIEVGTTTQPTVNGEDKWNDAISMKELPKIEEAPAEQETQSNDQWEKIRSFSGVIYEVN